MRRRRTNFSTPSTTSEPSLLKRLGPPCGSTTVTPSLKDWYPAQCTQTDRQKLPSADNLDACTALFLSSVLCFVCLHGIISSVATPHSPCSTEVSVCGDPRGVRTLGNEASHRKLMRRGEPKIVHRQVCVCIEVCACIRLACTRPYTRMYMYVCEGMFSSVLFVLDSKFSRLVMALLSFVSLLGRRLDRNSAASSSGFSLFHPTIMLELTRHFFSTRSREGGRGIPVCKSRRGGGGWVGSW